MGFAVNRLYRLAGLAVMSTLLALSALPARATTVINVGTLDLATRANFIFQGTPIEKWVAAGSQPGSVVTYFRFSVDDVLKGDRSRKTVVLRFLGGSMNGRTVSVEGMVMPQIGDEGIYFVEQLGRNQVNPLYGWDQGRFLVRPNAQGQKSVFTHDMRPVRRIDAARGSFGVNADRATGVAVAMDQRDALSLAAFKTRIRDLVEKQR